MEKRQRQHFPDGSFFDLILIEAGHFMMGSNEEEREQPIHKVQLSDFYLSQHPVTQALWLAVVGGENPAHFPGLRRPIESVSWYDAAAFCNRLNEMGGYPAVYYTDVEFTQPLDIETAKKVDYPNTIDIFMKPEKIGYCLPSEAQWEYAARGGKDPDQRPAYKYAGGDKLDEVGWYGDNSHRETKPVGIKLSNELGLYDMSGNVYEWCEDQWHDSYEDATTDGSAWFGLERDKFQVLRGGHGPDSNPQDCRSSSRSYSEPTSRHSVFGFRVLFSLPDSSPSNGQ